MLAVSDGLTTPPMQIRLKCCRNTCMKELATTTSAKVQVGLSLKTPLVNRRLQQVVLLAFSVF